MAVAARALALCLAGLWGCAPAPEPTPAPVAAAERLTPQVAALLNAGLVNSHSRATAFADAVARLLAKPDQTQHAAAVAAWKPLAEAVESWHWVAHLAPELAPGLSNLRALQYRVAAWPLQPAFLDDFGPFEHSGLVHAPDVPLTEASLAEQHGLTYAGEVVLGLYGVQFVLTGNWLPEAAHLQPLTQLNPQLRAQGFNQIEEVPVNRRRELLRLQTQLLVRDLAQAATLAPELRGALNQLASSKFRIELAAAGARMAAAWLEEWRTATDLPEEDAERAWLQAGGPTRAARQLRGLLAVQSLLETPAPAADAALAALSSGDLATAQSALAQWLVALGSR